MAIRHAIWKVSASPEQLVESALSNEQLLETMIVADPRILSDEWMLIGRQENTGYGGRVDLVAIAPDASLVLIELKRDRTPREVVAQALDYAGWVEKLKPEDVVAMYSRFAPSKDFMGDFQKRFGEPLDEESLNQSHQIIIVASSLDDKTERIVSYLSGHDIPINVLFFQVFTHGADQLISRAWLLDPVATQVNAATPSTASKEPWNGEYYACFGHSPEGRPWEEAVKYGFISAGGGEWYSNTLALLSPDDRVWVKAPGEGFVGVGRVTGKPERASEFKVKTPQGELPVLDVVKGSFHRQFADDPKRSEYFVPIEWLATVPIEKAFNEVGLFGNQNTVCRPKTPKWRHTVERLKELFPKHGG
jgi:hypothetical protein